MLVDYPVALQERLEHAIVQGELVRGRALDPEHVAAEYGATMAEAERVLAAGLRKGLLRRNEAGFEVLGKAVATVESLFQHAARAGMRPSTQVRAATVEPAGGEIAVRLCVAAGAPLYRMERTRQVGGEVVANQVNYLPYEVCPGLEHADLSQSSFQVLLEGHYHAVVTAIEESYCLEPASGQDREILSLPSGAEVLVVRRLSSGATGYPLVWAEIRIRPDRYHYVQTLWPGAAAALPQPPAAAAGMKHGYLKGGTRDVR